MNGVLVTCIEPGHAKPELSHNGEEGGSPDIQTHETFQEELEKQVQKRTSELVALNEELKKSAQHYHLMVEEVQDYAILFISREGFVQNWNRGAEKIKGYTTEEIIGKNFSSFYTERDRKNGLPQKLLNLALAHNRAVQEGWRVRKDGSLFWASVVITAVHNEHYEVIGFSKVTRDLTGKKRSADALKNKKIELEQKNVELENTNKRLQSFAYISSHDLQEPLRKIQTFASRIAEKERDNLSETGKYLFQRMQLSAERMQTLIGDLLAYTRTENVEDGFKTTDLNDIIEQVKQDLSDELVQYDVVIESPKSVAINIIPFQFKQLFYNLMSNSLKFSHSGKPVHINISNELVNGADLGDLNLDDTKTYCHIAYSDNGIGFDPQYKDRIFELFHRLHKSTEYPGTGIGLAIIKRIIENHKGAITAMGKLDQGAIFDIYIPADNR